MSMRLKSLLKPVFNLLAKPGLGNPHTPHEVELMIAGVKPVAIIGDFDMSPELKRTIDDGKVVLIYSNVWERHYRIHCHNDLVEQADQAAILFQNNWGKNTWSYEAVAFLDKLFAEKTEQPTPFFTQLESLDLAVTLQQETSPPLEAFEKGSSLILAPMRRNVNPDLDNRLDALAVARNLYSPKDMIFINLTHIIAQSSKVCEGRELYARYFGNSEGYQPVKDEEERIAELLGFTENDYAWHNGTKYQHPFIKDLMIKTDGMRHWARKEAMLLSPKL